MSTDPKADQTLLYPKLQSVFKQTWIPILILYVLLALLRGFGVFGPENIRMLIMGGFLLMWFLPFLFFSRFGWKSSGLRRVDKPLWFLWDF